MPTGLGAFFFFRRPLSALMLLARLVMQSVVILLGWLQRLWLLPGAPMAPAPDLAGRPVVVFSHGLGGFRSMYTVPCAELASQGYVVLAVEHTDGSSAAAKPAGTKKWLYYAGLGGEAGQVDKTRTRVAEMKAALQVLVAMGSGAALQGQLHLSPALPPSFLAGQLDMAAVAAVGHSYGGATVAALVSQDPRFACGVALDPWWFAMPPESAANTAWQTSTPLLILGSNTWNVPNEEGIKPCGERRQQAVLQAAERGGGALLLVIKGTSHNTFADPLPLFSRHAGWVLNRLGLSADLEPEKGMALVNTAVLAFLSTHLPLGGGARHEQTWGPEAGLALLGKYVDDDADATPTQRVLSSLYPGKGILVALSDELLMRAIKHPVVVSKLSESVESKRARHDGGPAIEDSASELSGGGLANDVLTGSEAAWSALPSTKPGSAGLVNGTKHDHVLAPSNKGGRITLEEGKELQDLLGQPQVFLMEVHS